MCISLKLSGWLENGTVVKGVYNSLSTAGLWPVDQNFCQERQRKCLRLAVAAACKAGTASDATTEVALLGLPLCCHVTVPNIDKKLKGRIQAGYPQAQVKRRCQCYQNTSSNQRLLRGDELRLCKPNYRSRWLAILGDLFALEDNCNMSVS